MNWLSPKRPRAPSSNLKTVSNGTANTTAEALPAVLDDATAAKSPDPERPPSSPRVLSHSVASSALRNLGGNLFYAVARQADDATPRFRLTFASASTANDWWKLIQKNFPDATRPSPQLFVFKDPEALSEAWRGSDFAHLKTKWMFTSASDADPKDLWDASQDIAPVQDEQGNILGIGSTAGREVNGDAAPVKAETTAIRNGFSRTDDRLEKLIAAIEKNTAQVATLADKQRRDADYDGESAKATNGNHSGAVDLAEQFSRINELLAKQVEHGEALAARQASMEDRLQSDLQSTREKQQQGQSDLTQLSEHLGRIQNLIEEGVKERKDSAKLSADHTPTSPALDLSPLTDRLEKIQEAIEQNSTLVRALLDEGASAESNPGTPFWGKATVPPQQLDFSPLTEHLQNIQQAIEQQSSHMQALVGFATGDADQASSDPQRGANDASEKGLAPFNEHLEQIYAAIEEGNKYVQKIATRDVPTPTLDLAPLSAKFDSLVEHLSSVRSSLETHSEHVKSLMDAQNVARSPDVVDSGAETLGDKLDEVNEHLQSLREWGEYDSEQLKELIELQKAAAEKQQTIDTDQLAAKLQEFRPAKALDDNSKRLDFSPLTTHLEAIRTGLAENHETIQSLLEMHPPPASTEIDLTPLTERLSRIYAVLEKQSDKKDPAPGSGDAKFLMSALSSHLSKIQAVTEQNAQHVKSLREKAAASQDRMQNAVTETAEQVRTLLQRQIDQDSAAGRLAGDAQRLEQRLEATNSQVRELMSGQREMVEVMRELARSITAANKGQCDHVVIPPPRKMGRKLVGFVYDAKADGP